MSCAECRDACFNLTSFNLTLFTQASRAWDYLACTEIVHPIGCNNVTDMFPPSPWTVQSQTAYCLPTWAVAPRPEHIPRTFGFDHLENLAMTASRIFWAYGKLDPWHTLGLKQPVNNRCLSLALPCPAL